MNCPARHDIASPFFVSRAKSFSPKWLIVFGATRGQVSAQLTPAATSQLVMRLLFVVLGTSTASTTAAVVLRDDRSLGKVVPCVVLSIHGFRKALHFFYKAVELLTIAYRSIAWRF